MMKIAFFTHYAELYGANRSLLALIDGLGRYDVQSHVIAPKSGPLNEYLAQRQVPFAAVPFADWMHSLPKQHTKSGFSLRTWYRGRRGAARKVRQNLRLLPQIAALASNWAIDLFYTNTSVIPIGAMAARYAHRPHIWHLREFGELDYRLTPDWGRRLFRHGLLTANSIIAISQAILSYHVPARAQQSQRVHVVYNGVAWTADFDRRKLLAEQQPADGDRPFTFAIVGYVHREKGQDTAIQALSLLQQQHPSIRLLIAGSGEIEAHRQLAATLGVQDKVEFLGFVPDPLSTYFASDAVLVCSENEAMGRVAPEAMSACRPVIGFDQAGTAELIEDGVTGLLYRGGADALATKMRLLLEQPLWARELGLNSWKAACQKYNIETYSDTIYQVLSAVMNRRSAHKL